MKISSKLLAVGALLASSASMAASVTVVPSSATPTVGSSFSVIVHGDGFPSTAGATLGLTWNSAVASVTSIVLAPGSTFTGGVVAAAPWNPISIIGPLVGTLPSGSFDSFQINFQALAAGAANIQLVDDQADLCWTDAVTNFCVAPITYQQANVTVTAPVVPVPAAAWLLMSALGSIAGIKRLRRA